MIDIAELERMGGGYACRRCQSVVYGAVPPEGMYCATCLPLARARLRAFASVQDATDAVADPGKVRLCGMAHLPED